MSLSCAKALARQPPICLGIFHDAASGPLAQLSDAADSTRARNVAPIVPAVERPDSRVRTPGHRDGDTCMAPWWRPQPAQWLVTRWKDTRGRVAPTHYRPVLHRRSDGPSLSNSSAAESPSPENSPIGGIPEPSKGQRSGRLAAKLSTRTELSQWSTSPRDWCQSGRAAPTSGSRSGRHRSGSTRPSRWSHSNRHLVGHTRRTRSDLDSRSDRQPDCSGDPRCWTVLIGRRLLLRHPQCRHRHLRARSRSGALRTR